MSVPSPEPRRSRSGRRAASAWGPAWLPRSERLAARVRWLDRYRRLLAIGAAAVVAPVLIERVDQELGAEWPRMHAAMLSVMLGVIVWWVIEVGLVYVTALWETEQVFLARSRGLPAARIWRHRRRR